MDNSSEDNDSSLINSKDGDDSIEKTNDEDYDKKSRFNLRKRVGIYTEDDYADDEDEYFSYTKPLVPVKSSKKGGKKCRAYSNEAIKQAVKMVLSKKMTILDASKHFNIPRTSLHNFVSSYKKSKKYGLKSLSSSLTPEEETEIVTMILKLIKCGKRYSHNEFRFLVQLYLMNNDRPVFKSGTLPTMGWVAGFVERNPDLLQAKSKKNTKVAVEDVEEWYKNISNFLIDDWHIDIDEMFNFANADRIFCFNAFRMNVNSPAESVDKSLIRREHEECKMDQEAGVILGMCANGDFFSPVVVLTEECRESCSQLDPSQLRISFNSSGRIDPEIALRVIQDFHGEILRKKVKKPVILFLNDKQDFAHYSVIEYCWDNEICIVCLPPRTTKTMTPFEVSVWPKIRASYAAYWKNAPKPIENKISLSQFPCLFFDTWESVKNPRVVARSFTKAGLIPFDIRTLFKDSTATTSTNNSMSISVNAESCTAQSANNNMMVEPKCEEKSRGKIEGIQMSLQAIESFIPPDILPVWQQRDPNYKGRCELSFKLWRSVSLLLKAGCAIASIHQMTDGIVQYDDFSSSDEMDTEDLSFHDELAKQTKLKVNKSIYSSANDTKTINIVSPLVRLYDSGFLNTDNFNSFS